MTKSIVVIEDAKDIVEMLTDILKGEGYIVNYAYDGAAGLNLVKQTSPDLVISDIVMPVMDGYSVLQALRMEPAFALIPFIFLSAKDDKEEIRTGMNLGADDYLTKPVSSKTLLKAVKIRLEKADKIKKRVNDAVESLTGIYLPHEFRTPLTGIFGIGELLKRDASGSDELREYGSILLSCGKRLLRLVENITLFHELRSGYHRCVNEKVSTKIFSKKLLERFVEDPRHKDIKVDIEEKELSIHSNLVLKAICELIDNAVKFSESGTIINVTGKTDGDSFRFSVTDQGRGMKKSQIAAIGAFKQFDREKFEQQGAGLGLAIVIQVCNLSGIVFEILPNEKAGITAVMSLPQ